MILYRYTNRLYRYIEYRDISMYRHPKCILLDTINAVVVHYGCELFNSATISRL